MRRVTLFLVAVLIALPAFGDEPEDFTAKVITVHDGDTMRVRRVTDDRFYKLRLFAIDAPEISQQSGPESRDALKALIGTSDIRVRTTGAKTYGRHVARVYVGANYLNEAQVVDGWAWHYSNYTNGQPEHTEFAAAQVDAKADGAGLWAYPDPIAPWIYRQMVASGEIAGPSPAGVFPMAEPANPLLPRPLRPAGVNRPAIAVPERAQPAALVASGHFLGGRPKPFDLRHRFTPPGHPGEVAGITELSREAFSIGHYDKYRVPAWVAMKWTKANFDQSEEVSFSRPPWKEDTDLPVYARGDGKLDYAHTTLQKGHMARDADIEAWGLDAVKEATRLSNAVPQKEHANHAVWGVLEDEHRHIVENSEDEFTIDTVWVISGPIFFQGQDVQHVGITGIPHATYKVLAWLNADGEVRTRGYIIGQDETSTNLVQHLRPIDQIEAATGFDFFPDLEDTIEDELEGEEHSSLWE